MSPNNKDVRRTSDMCIEHAQSVQEAACEDVPVVERVQGAWKGTRLQESQLHERGARGIASGVEFLTRVLD